jgi:hypothetical protein
MQRKETELASVAFRNPKTHFLQLDRRKES